MVGKKLVKRLYEEGAKSITCLDIMETPVNLRFKNVVYKKCDITDLPSLLECTKNHDVLIHLAAFSASVISAKDYFSSVMSFLEFINIYCSSLDMFSVSNTLWYFI